MGRFLFDVVSRLTRFIDSRSRRDLCGWSVLETVHQVRAHADVANGTGVVEKKSERTKSLYSGGLIRCFRLGSRLVENPPLGKVILKRADAEDVTTLSSVSHRRYVTCHSATGSGGFPEVFTSRRHTDDPAIMGVLVGSWIPSVLNRLFLR